MLEANLDGVWVPLTPDEYYITEAADGLDTLEFSLLRTEAAAGLLRERMRLRETTGGQTFWVSGIDAGQKTVEFTCMKDLSDWQKAVYLGFSNGSKAATVGKVVKKVLPAGWRVVFPDGEGTLEAQFTLQGPTALEVVSYALEIYGYGAVYDNQAKVLYLHDLGKKTLGPGFFVETANLRARPEYKGKASALVTRLYAQGAEGVTFQSVNGGKNYVECFDYTDEVIAGYWRDDRYTVPEHLLAAAKEKLRLLCRPEQSWTIDVCDLYAIDPERWPEMELRLFDVAQLVDQSRGNHLGVQIMEKRSCPHHPEKNQVTVSAVAGAMGMTISGIRRWLNRGRAYENLEISMDEIKAAAEEIRQEAQTAQDTAEDAKTTADAAKTTADGAEEAASTAVAAVMALEDSILLTVEDGALGKEAAIRLSVAGEEQVGTIDLSGAVTFQNLETQGQTTIHGGNIQTGTITADKINVEDLMAQDITATGDFQVNNGAWEIRTLPEKNGVAMGCGLDEGETQAATVVCRPSKVEITAGGTLGTVELLADTIALIGEMTINGTAIESLFAPGDCGLGASAPRYTDVAELDSLVGCRFFSYFNTAAPLVDGDTNTRSAVGISLAYSAAYGMQIAFCANNGAKLVRRKHSGVWGPWLYENPPMEAGVEYATTEKRDGEIVYRKRVTYKNEAALAPAGGIVTVSVPHGISGFGQSVRVHGKVGSNLLPHMSGAGSLTTVTAVGTGNITVRSGFAWGAGTGWDFDLAYTKA